MSMKLLMTCHEINTFIILMMIVLLIMIVYQSSFEYQIWFVILLITW